MSDQPNNRAPHPQGALPTLLVEFIAAAPTFAPGFIHIGNGEWYAVVRMLDYGEHLMFLDCGLHLYRGPRLGDSELFYYGFHPDAVSPKVIRRVTWIQATRGIRKLFGRDPDRPTPWIDTHPIYQILPNGSDVLLQTNLNHPDWNRIKSFTQAGNEWLKRHIWGDDLAMLTNDGTFAVVQPQDYGILADDAEAAGLSVWRH